MTTWLRAPLVSFAAAVALLVCGAVATWILWRRGRRAEGVVVGALDGSIFLAVWVHYMSATGAGAVGWPIAWSLPLSPLRAVGLLGYPEAYYLGLAILLLCNAVTVVATALIARRLVPGCLALLAPALLIVWPFMLLHLGQSGTVVYGSWLDDQGLILYSEPLSTALVTTGLALLVLRRADPTCAALAGVMLGYSTVVRLSNLTLVLVCFAALLIAASAPSVIAFALAALSISTIGAAFWPHGYVTLHHSSLGETVRGVFGWRYIVPNWQDSAVFDSKMLVLFPLAILGLYSLRRQLLDASLLGAIVVVTALFYSPYSFTALHPRFLFVALPSLFVLEAAGVACLAATATEMLSEKPPQEGHLQSSRTRT